MHDSLGKQGLFHQTALSNCSFYGDALCFFELKTEFYIIDMDLMFQNVKTFQYMKKINKVL